MWSKLISDQPPRDGRQREINLCESHNDWIRETQTITSVAQPPPRPFMPLHFRACPELRPLHDSGAGLVARVTTLPFSPWTCMNASMGKHGTGRGHHLGGGIDRGLLLGAATCQMAAPVMVAAVPGALSGRYVNPGLAEILPYVIRLLIQGTSQ